MTRPLPPQRQKVMAERRTLTPAKPARGTAFGDRRKIAIGFPKALFDQINNLAATNGRSFSEQAIVLCEATLEKRTALNPVALEIVDSPRSTVEGF